MTAMAVHASPNGTAKFAREVREKSGQQIQLCYQCRKCASGCPMGEFTDYYPNQILRLIQFGRKEEVLRSKAIWLCFNCEICGARCPNGINMAVVMDALRQMALEEKIPAGIKNAPLFHRVFLNSVKSRGRVHETFMMMGYKLKSGDLFSDLDIGLKMFQKRKLPLFASSVKNNGEVKRIFARASG
ncbi:heterodisulfide reductase [Desulfofundulus thermobenzoicus]|uniref:Heterodisulfide reductase n=1 Tax=Desulfofundulus thermobenzoicus TaxID=29376 RepID=A0A6N7IVC1_9FIRM|nr:4Fe-4S dicluster domain-containing protein [Desulfofundulus thermobenzoicus]MQL53449.1 heterodisulfide reductase [Desulfofundulus thermobenzoicus]HHW44769.1 heterodisulfide reductase [Desulfotomaculum sp.]